MKIINKIFANTTFGQASLASLLICLVSGIFIAIPYDIENPLSSISSIMILNPAASFIRNLHFWSAQFFLILTLLHIWDHFNKKNTVRLKIGVWLRLSLGVVIIFLAMLSGFLLKGDADSNQAWRILESLTNSLPFIGSLLSSSLLGNEGNLQLIYVHHIATFTVFIILISFEHSRKIWPNAKDFFLVSLLSVVVSLLFTAPLHDGVNTSVKGPWYFVGFQEILHWLSAPTLSLFFIALFIALIFIVPYAGKRLSFFSKRGLLVISIVYIVLTIIGMFFRGENWKWITPFNKGYNESVMHSFKTPSINIKTDFTSQQLSSSNLVDGKKESCIVCHSDVVGFTDSHNPEAIGCFSCHGGNPFDGNKEGSHRGMINIPGNFADADKSCGTVNCHPDISQRKNSNLMSNLSGMISVDRYVFNEQQTPDDLTNVHSLANTAADEHLKNMCVVCHLDNPKTETGPVTEKSRGGGCLACHINYDEFASTAWLSHSKNNSDTNYLKYHPSISMKVTNQHCFGCHSRSARISTNYEGWHETTMEIDEMPISKAYRLVEDSRVFRFIEDDVHHRLDINCIDCHNSYELMGDGNLYAHQEHQNTITCGDCHFAGKPETINSKNLDQESAIIASMRFGDINNREFLSTRKRNIPLINTYYKNDTAYFLTKNTSKKFVLSKPGISCTKGKAHDNVSCSACHSSWAPSCIGCHNEYDVNEPGFDMQKNIEKSGTWVEYVGEFNAHLPALGIRTDNGKEIVIPVVPGMVLTIDIGSFNKQLHDSLIFQRLFAPAAPHTTNKHGRDCKSCHFNSTALGYGEGKLKVVDNKVEFDSKYRNNPNDNLPEDAWIPFMGKPNAKYATRSNLDPFSIEKQKRILQVGVCLTCHNDKSDVMQQSLIDYDKLLETLSPQCILVY